MHALATVLAAASLLSGGSPNPIQTENAQQGADPSSWVEPAVPPTSVEGYASETSVLSGEDVHFHVSTVEGDRYRIEVYRLALRAEQRDLECGHE